MEILDFGKGGKGKKKKGRPKGRPITTTVYVCIIVY